MLRNAWIMQVVTDWMGDDAVLVAVDDRIKGFNTLGDLTRITGSVTAIETAPTGRKSCARSPARNQRERRPPRQRAGPPARARRRAALLFQVPCWTTWPAAVDMLVPVEGPWAND